MGTGIPQCWEGNRLAVEEVWRAPYSKHHMVEFGPIAHEREMGTPEQDRPLYLYLLVECVQTQIL